MSGDNERRSIWERLDDNRPRDHWFDARTRWRVGSLAQSMAAEQTRVDRLVGETEAFLQGVAMPPADQVRRGDPGE